MVNFLNVMGFIFIFVEIIVIVITYYQLLKRYRFAVNYYKKNQNSQPPFLVAKGTETVENIIIPNITQAINEEEIQEMMNLPTLNFLLDGNDILKIHMSNEKFFIGRGKSDDVFINEITVSRSNCMITKENDKYFITIEKDKNPVQLNRRLIGKGGTLKKEISNGDVVSMGNGRVSFEFILAY